MFTAIKHRADEVTSLWLICLPVALMWPQSISSHPEIWNTLWIIFCFNLAAWSCLTLAYHLSQALNYAFGQYLQKVSGAIYLTLLSWVLILLAISPSTLTEHPNPDIRTFSLVILNVWFASKTWNLFKNQPEQIPDPWNSGMQLAIRGFPILAPVYIWSKPVNKKMILAYCSDLKRLNSIWRLERVSWIRRNFRISLEQLNFIKEMLIETIESIRDRLTGTQCHRS